MMGVDTSRFAPPFLFGKPQENPVRNSLAKMGHLWYTGLVG